MKAGAGEPSGKIVKQAADRHLDDDELELGAIVQEVS